MILCTFSKEFHLFQEGGISRIYCSKEDQLDIGMNYASENKPFKLRVDT